MATEIQSPALFRVKDKATHETFYLVQSDTQAHTWYEVHFDNSALVWRCNCESRRSCKHVNAVNEILRLRRIRIAEAMGGLVPATVAGMQADEDRRTREALPLNGNRPFSLMR